APVAKVELSVHDGVISVEDRTRVEELGPVDSPVGNPDLPLNQLAEEQLVVQDRAAPVELAFGELHGPVGRPIARKERVRSRQQRDVAERSARGGPNLHQQLGGTTKLISIGLASAAEEEVVTHLDERPQRCVLIGPNDDAIVRAIIAAGIVVEVVPVVAWLPP